MDARLLSRRHLIAGGVGLIVDACAPKSWANPLFSGFPFTLGVASGYPQPDGVCLWTRLAPDPLAPNGSMPPEPVPVQYEISVDDHFRSIVDQGLTWAEPMFAHSVHKETTKLAPGRDYWYRFHAGGATSSIGRTRSAPPVTQMPTKLRLAFASCQQYEQGFYGAYRHMAREDLDFIIHLGDYIYERSSDENKVRFHTTPEPETLDDYRARYALYKSDRDLQSAHANFPWLMVWDDHDVENDYADDRSENMDDPRWFMYRRAAAYQAWYEHMPVRRTMVPFNGFARIYSQAVFGGLLEVNLLDERQYRSPQPCPKPGRGGSNFVENCAARLDPATTLLGARQEQWLEAKLAASKGRWNVLAQQTLVAQADRKRGDGQEFYTDSWDGYPAARARLMETFLKTKATNPVVIGGDRHAFFVADLKQDFDHANSPTIASEFCGTSITSSPPTEEKVLAAKSEGPHIKFATGAYRGYSVMTITPQSLKTELRVVSDHRDPNTKVSTLASFVVNDGRPGAEQDA